MATHSPILMAHPGSALLKMARYGLQAVELEATDLFRIMCEFVQDPGGMVRSMIEG